MEAIGEFIREFVGLVADICTMYSESGLFLKTINSLGELITDYAIFLFG